MIRSRPTTPSVPNAAPDAREPQAPAILEECSTFAIHDLAALADGQLSQDGMRRLASHLPTCRTCMATLVALVEDIEHGEASGNHDLAALLAVANSARTAECGGPGGDADDGA
jgi:anti-sigma factor RsiW